MRAWVVKGGFGLDRLVCETRPAPAPGPGEVALRMRAVSLNYRDLMMVQGAYNPRQPLPLVPCSDGVGEVVAVGEGVQAWAVGDRVCPIFAQGWLAGDVPDDANASTLGGPLDGTLREVMTVPAHAVVRAPDHLTDAEAACLPCAAVTAWRALAVEGGVRAGDTVLTLGTGGVSLFAVQLGTMMGAQVIVTSSQDVRLERARALGAVAGVNYVDDKNWGRSVVALTGGRGVDVVVELGGAGTLDQSLRAVRAGGRIALIGVLAGVKTELALTKVFMRGIQLRGVLVGSKADFLDLNRALTARPDVRPSIDRVFGFDEVPEAFAHMQAAGHLGKIVVAVNT